MLQFDNISKSFATQTVLNGLNLKLDAGKTFVLIGPSGCGKSTILRLIVGLIQPDSGSVTIDGKTLSRENAQELRRRIGYVIQEGGLFPHLSAEENIALMARYLNWNEKRIQTRLQELTELTQFPNEMLSRFPAQLSGGQRQRVSLMRALMLDPDILLLDEPLGALDPMIRAELQNDLRLIFRKLQKTVVLVTHDLREAAYLGDLMFLMRNGNIVQSGTLRDFLQSPEDPFVTEFTSAQRSIELEES